MRGTAWITGLLLLTGLTGCQCCGLTDRYANSVDCIADHEHAFERFYCPGWDLNRIGRPDWCSYRFNQRLCPCACQRVRPAPCEFAVYDEIGIVGEQISQPEWADRMSIEETPVEEMPIDEPPEFEGDVPPIPERERAVEDLELP